MTSSPSPSPSPPPSPYSTIEDDICGITLLDLVCRGHVLIANVLKSSTQIPPCFRSPPPSSSPTSNNTKPSSFSLKSLKNNLYNNLIGSSNDNIDRAKTTGGSVVLEEERMGGGGGGGGGVVIGDSKDGDKYRSILIDFAYFANPERFDQHDNTSTDNPNNSNTNTNREQLEQEFQTMYQTTLISFHNLFNDIYNLYLDLHTVCDNLVKGRYVRYDTLESIFLVGGGGDGGEGRRLLCEVLYVYGSLLILTDLYIPGDVRERLIIAHYRYCSDKGSTSGTSSPTTTTIRGDGSNNGGGGVSSGKDGPFSVSNFEELCKLFRRTHRVKDTIQQTPPQTQNRKQQQEQQQHQERKQQQNTKPSSSTRKPPPAIIQEDLLTRLPLPSPVLLNVIESLITYDDPYYAHHSLYPTTTVSPPPLAFPQFQHRTTQLAHQASLLFVTLLFHPQTLHTDTMRMNLIVHKFFPDNWILILYDGTPIDLSIEWSTNRFNAAGRALSEGSGGSSGVVHPSNLSRLYRANAKLVGECIERIRTVNLRRRQEDGVGVGSSTSSGGRRVGDEDVECALFVLERGNEALDCLRCANVALRWQILHRIGGGDGGDGSGGGGKALNQIGFVIPSIHPRTIAASIGLDTGPLGGSVAADDLMTLLLTTSQFEARMRDVYIRTLRRRKAIWVERKVGAKGKMVQLSDYYAGGKENLEDGVVRERGMDGGLRKWFGEMAGEIDSLEYPYGNGNSDVGSEPSSILFASTERKIQLCVQALDEVEHFDLIDRNDQVKLVLAEARTCLFHMVKIVRIPEDVCTTIDAIADFSYGRRIMEEYYVSTLHGRAIRDPKSLGSLRPFFLKMTTFLAVPTARLKQRQRQQARIRRDLQPLLPQTVKDDATVRLDAVTNFYAGSMLAFVTRILDVIPISIFSTLSQIVDIKEKSLMVLPSKIDVDLLKDYSRFEDRYRLAKITHELSVLTAGIFRMEATSIGNVEIHPQTLLERGLRRELVRQISSAHHRLQFRIQDEAKKKMKMKMKMKGSGGGDGVQPLLKYFKEECIRSFSNLARRVEGFRRAIEYIQDFLDIAGLKIFSEETSRVIGYNLEQEVQKYITRRPSSFQSKYASFDVPIPHYPRSDTDPYSSNFIGRTINAMMKLTDFKSTIYSRHLNGWLLPSGEEICGIEMVSLLRKAIGVHGILALDVLLSHKISHELGRFFKYYNNTVQKYGAILEKIRDGLFPEWSVPKDGIDLYDAAVRKTGKLMVPLRMCFCRVGQMQLLRKMLRNELRLSAKLDARKLSYSADLMNLEMMRHHLMDNQDNDALGNENRSVFKKVSDIVICTGGGDPMATIFMNADPLEGLPILITLFIISHVVAKSDYDAEMGSLVGTEEEPFDGWVTAAGISTILRQFHPSYAKSVFALLSQYIRCSILLTQAAEPNKERLSLSSEQRHVMIFMAHLRLIGNFTTSALFEHLPQHVIDMLAATTEIL